MTPPAPAADPATERVRVFGGTLLADRTLPGLPLADGPAPTAGPVWTLQTEDADDQPAHTPGSTITGRMIYTSGPVVTLAGHLALPEIVFSDTGRFTIDPAAHRITHRAPRSVDRAAVALDLIGIVIPYLLHGGGAWCLHASAVQTPGGVVVFLAPRGTGKSTLAAACVRAGCALVADDVVVVAVRDGVLVVTPAGVPLRLRGETAAAVGVQADAPDGWGKVRVNGTAAASPRPLAAIYCLSPAAADAPIERQQRSVRAAALALLTQGKITELLGGAAAANALDRCVTLAGRVPVYDLAVPRDLARVPAVVDALSQWHATPASIPFRA